MRRYFGLVVASALLIMDASAAVNFVADVEAYAGDHGSADANQEEDKSGQLRRAILAHSDAIAQTSTTGTKLVERSDFDADEAPEPEFEGEVQQLQGQEPNRVTDTAGYNNEDDVDTESISVQVNAEQVRWDQDDGEVSTLPTTLAPASRYDDLGYEKLLGTGGDLHANVHGDDEKKIEQYCSKIAGADGDWYNCDQEPGFLYASTKKPESPPPEGDDDDITEDEVSGAAYTDPPETKPTPAPTPAGTTTTTDSGTSTGTTTGGTTTTTQSGTSTGAKGGTTTTTTEGTTGTAYTDTTSGTVAPDPAAYTAGTKTGTTTKTGAGAALSAGAIAGIVIGCAVFVAIVVGAVLFKQKSLARQREENLFTDFGGDYAAM